MYLTTNQRKELEQEVEDCKADLGRIQKEFNAHPVVMDFRIKAAQVEGRIAQIEYFLDTDEAQIE
jgi:cell fate (sporulation/competence/biofilm development) regulator YmcA (YheA/YmcA/DUF963 family)